LSLYGTSILIQMEYFLNIITTALHNTVLMTKKKKKKKKKKKNDGLGLARDALVGFKVFS